jgi:hypothetical protein
MTERIPQIGETIRNRVGSNLPASFAIMQEIRTIMEQVNEASRVQAILQQHLDGKVSALAVQYGDIVKCPEILDFVTPISREPDIDGKIVLWEGYQRPAGNPLHGSRGERGQLHRVIQHANGHRVFCKFNSVLGSWNICEARDPETGAKIPNRFPAPVFRRRASDDWADVGGNTVSRTVMSPKGETTTRVFDPSWKPRSVRR